MSAAKPFHVDAPELRLLCQLAGIKPSAFAAALNNPEHFSEFVTADELFRYLVAVEHLMALVSRISLVVSAGLEKAKERANAR